MTQKKSSLTPGFVLIAIGIYFLMRRLIDTFTFWYQVYPILILVFAALLLVESIRTRRSSPLFWGIFLLCIGSFFILRNYNIFPSLDICDIWPVILIALGVAFFARYMANLRAWGILIPGTLLLYFGLKIFLYQLFELSWDDNLFIDYLWPMIPIVIGIGIIISGITKAAKRKEVTE